MLFVKPLPFPDPFNFVDVLFCILAKSLSRSAAANKFFVRTPISNDSKQSKKAKG